MTGGPVGDHPRRCQAWVQKKAKQCGKWANKGRRYCQIHGGRRPLMNRDGMPRFYSKHLGKTLKGRLEEFLGTPHHEQVQVYEELALARAMALDAVKLYEASLGKDIKPVTRKLARDALDGALTRVRDLCLAASRIEKEAEDKVSINALDLFVMQIVREIFTVCGKSNEALARRIETGIKENVRFPISKVGETGVNIGTDSTPDLMVGEMDALTAPGED